MEYSLHQDIPRPDRLLRTLEQLLNIDAIEVKLALQQAAQLLSEALAAEKVDVFFYDPATHRLGRTKAWRIDQWNNSSYASVGSSGSVRHSDQTYRKALIWQSASPKR